MELITKSLDFSIPFLNYLLSASEVKHLCKEFEFYEVKFLSDMKTSSVQLQYPKGNPYWLLDFKKYIEEKIYPLGKYIKDWKQLLSDLSTEVRKDYNSFKTLIENIKSNVKALLQYKTRYFLRDDQALDAITMSAKYILNGKQGLILSDPRVGKTRVALAVANEQALLGDSIVIICPKSAQLGWATEIDTIRLNTLRKVNKVIISSLSKFSKIVRADDAVNIYIISYDLFKRITDSQYKFITSKTNNTLMIIDEAHRLRNFETLQSKAIFKFKDFCKKKTKGIGVLGLTATPSIKSDDEVFGVLSLVNNSKINLRPTLQSQDLFKEYFYHCEDTTFGKKAKTLKREDEINYVLQTLSVQTKQRDLNLFQNYTKKYLKFELEMDSKQREIYEAVASSVMEYNDGEIDCENKLVQLIRLQQICIDPSGLVADYDLISPKLRWIVNFVKKNPMKMIVAAKKTTPLKHLMKILDDQGIKYSSILGSYKITQRAIELDSFMNEDDVLLMILQLDTGKEALTIPAAQATIFLDRDFAQGFNEQAEARMTPIDGHTCTKFVIDLIMKDSKEEDIYQTLVIRKESITAMNTVFKRKEK